MNQFKLKHDLSLMNKNLVDKDMWYQFEQGMRIPERRRGEIP